MTLANFEVDGVVTGRHLEGACAEFRLNGLVADDGHGAADDGQRHIASDKMAVSLVVGVDCHTGVAQHGLGAGGGYGDMAVRFPVLGGQWVADVVQGPFMLLVLYFEVRKGGGAAGAPVDDALAAVYQALVVQVDEGGAHRQRRPRIESEAQARPVAGCAQPFVLLVNGVAVTLHPLPDSFQKGVPPQLCAAGAFLGQLALHHPLGGDASVVLAGQPESGVPHHTVPAD